jgi:Dullard-like phosphatase family protein
MKVFTILTIVTITDTSSPFSNMLDLLCQTIGSGGFRELRAPVYFASLLACVLCLLYEAYQAGCWVVLSCRRRLRPRVPLPKVPLPKSILRRPSSFTGSASKPTLTTHALPERARRCAQARRFHRKLLHYQKQMGPTIHEGPAETPRIDQSDLVVVLDMDKPSCPPAPTKKKLLMVLPAPKKSFEELLLALKMLPRPRRLESSLGLLELHHVEAPKILPPVVESPIYAPVPLEPLTFMPSAFASIIIEATNLLTMDLEADTSNTIPVDEDSVTSGEGAPCTTKSITAIDSVPSEKGADEFESIDTTSTGSASKPTLTTHALPERALRCAQARRFHRKLLHYQKQMGPTIHEGPAETPRIDQNDLVVVLDMDKPSCPPAPTKKKLLMVLPAPKKSFEELLKMLPRPRRLESSLGLLELHHVEAPKILPPVVESPIYAPVPLEPLTFMPSAFASIIIEATNLLTMDLEADTSNTIPVDEDSVTSGEGAPCTTKSITAIDSVPSEKGADEFESIDTTSTGSASKPTDIAHALPERARRCAQARRFHRKLLHYQKQMGPTIHEGPAETPRIYQSDLVVVLDMDECLIHTPRDSFRHVDDEEAGPAAGINSFPVQLKDGRSIRVNERPFVREFLLAVSAKYETHIYTAGASSYANAVLDQLDPEGSIFTARWYRETCEFRSDVAVYVKNLSNLSYSGGLLNESRTVLVDNNKKSFLSNPSNGILVPNFTQDPNDQALVRVLRVLELLESKPDVRHEIGQSPMKLCKSSILSSRNLVAVSPAPTSTITMTTMTTLTAEPLPTFPEEGGAPCTVPRSPNQRPKPLPLPRRSIRIATKTQTNLGSIYAARGRRRSARVLAKM